MRAKRSLLIVTVCLTLSYSCTPQEQTDVQTRVAELSQTVAAEAASSAQTTAAGAVATGASAAQTSAAEALSAVETEVAGRVGSPSRQFTVENNLNEVVNVTGSELDAAIKAVRADSPLIGLGEDFVRIGREKEINAFYIAAHAAWESAWGTSPLAQDKNNLFGYGAYDSCPYECAWTFATKAESVEVVMTRVKEDYLTEGGKYYNGPTLSGMNVRYASDQNWKNGIASIMNSLAAKVP